MSANSVSFKMIVAYCKNRGIGYDNKIPWISKKDMRYFSKVTTGNKNNSIIMGRKTWESIPKKPLKNRVNIVLSHDKNFQDSITTENTYVFNNIENAILFCKKRDYDTNWIIGGYSLYNHFLSNNLIDELLVTYIPEEYICDVFFPEIPSNFKITKERNEKENNMDIQFLTYQRSK